MSSFLDMMLRPDAPDVQKALPRASYEVKRLSRLAGEPVALELRALPYGKAQELREALKDERLAARFGGASPAETVKAMLLPGEIAELSRAVERLSGYRQNTIREIKNG